MRNLRNNVSRFQKELEIRNLILVRNRKGKDQQKDRVYPSKHQIAFEHGDERVNMQIDRVQEANSFINENDNEQELRTVMKLEDQQQLFNNNLIPVWRPSGRTVLLQKIKDLTDKRIYCPITCLKTSYKLLTGLVAKYMRENTMENDIWNEEQLGAVVGVLGTVDQLL